MSTKKTILKVTDSGQTYVATDVEDAKRKVSCTMGKEQAAIAWCEKFAPDAGRVREAKFSETEHLKPSKVECVYYTWETKAPEAPKAFAVGLDQLEAHPSLARVSLVPDVATDLAAAAHGDPKRIELANDAAANWSAWVEEIRQNGVIEPLRVVRRPVGTAPCSPLPGYWIVEGRHRFEAARESGKTTVPVIEVAEEDLPTLAVGTVTGRRHWTKSQRAFFAVIMNPEIATEAKRGPKGIPAAAAGITSQPDLAARFGVSERLLRDAIELYRGLEKYPDLKPRFEPSLWGGASLEGLLQGFRAATDPVQPTGPGTSLTRHPVGNLKRIWVSERAHALNWEKADNDFRIVLASDLRTEAEQMPRDYLEWKLGILTSIIGKEGEQA